MESVCILVRQSRGVPEEINAEVQLADGVVAIVKTTSNSSCVACCNNHRELGQLAYSCSVGDRDVYDAHVYVFCITYLSPVLSPDQQMRFTAATAKNFGSKDGMIFGSQRYYIGRVSERENPMWKKTCMRLRVTTRIYAMIVGHCAVDGRTAAECVCKIIDEMFVEALREDPATAKKDLCALHAHVMKMKASPDEIE